MGCGLLGSTRLVDCLTFAIPVTDLFRLFSISSWCALLSGSAKRWTAKSAANKSGSTWKRCIIWKHWTTSSHYHSQTRRQTSTFHQSCRASWSAPNQRTARDPRRIRTRDGPHPSQSQSRARSQTVNAKLSSQSPMRAGYNPSGHVEAFRPSLDRQPARRRPQPSVVEFKVRKCVDNLMSAEPHTLKSRKDTKA